MCLRPGPGLTYPAVLGPPVLTAQVADAQELTRGRRATRRFRETGSRVLGAKASSLGVLGKLDVGGGGSSEVVGVISWKRLEGRWSVLAELSQWGGEPGPVCGRTCEDTRPVTPARPGGVFRFLQQVPSLKRLDLAHSSYKRSGHLWLFRGHLQSVAGAPVCEIALFFF